MLPDLEVGKCHISEFNHQLGYSTLGFFVTNLPKKYSELLIVRAFLIRKHNLALCGKEVN